MTRTDDTLEPPRLNADVSPLDAASEWAAYLQSGVAAEDDIRSLRRWLRSSPDNAAAFQKVAQSWEDVGLAAMSEELDRDERRFSHSEPQPQPVPGFRPSRRWFLPASVAASIALAVGTGLWMSNPAPVNAFQYATSTGEVREVTLADGSKITLGGATSVTGRFSKRLREIDLDRGRAFFDVSSDPDRPFRVAVSQSQIEVLGTAFDIEYGPDTVQVSVTHGRVNVSPRARTDQTEPTLLTAGKRVRATLSGTVGAPTNYDVNSLSWRDGQLAYIDARLEDVIAEVNRYRDQKIRIADSALEDLRVSFNVASNQTDILLAGLEATIPIQVVRSASGVILYKESTD